MPTAELKDWELVSAGQRVQVIKKGPKEGGILEFGRELVTASDVSLAALLGASPGASIAVSIMLKLVVKCFPEWAGEGQEGLKQMVPSHGRKLAKDAALIKEVRIKSHTALGLVVPG